MRTTSGRASGDVPPAPLSGACGRAGPGPAGYAAGMAIILESAGPNPNHDPARRGYAVAVAVSNLDAAVAQSKAAAALLLAAAAEIRKLPAIDVVTERHGDSAPAQACHAAVSADIRDQLSRPVRKAFAELDAACRRYRATVSAVVGRDLWDGVRIVVTDA